MSGPLVVAVVALALWLLVTHGWESAREREASCPHCRREWLRADGTGRIYCPRGCIG